MDIYSRDFTVTLSDVGENNCITNKGILRIFQEAACIHSSLVGFGLNDAKNTGLFWFLLNWKLQVFNRPIWNSSLKVSTWCTGHTHTCFYRDFKMCDDSGNVVAVASSKWILYDFIKSSIVKIDKGIESKYYKDIDDHVFDKPMVEKLLEPSDSEFISEYTVCKRDIDSNHHVNNLNYLDFAYDILPNDFDFKNIEIMYKHEVKFGETIDLFYAEKNNTAFVTMKNHLDKTLHCIIKLY